MRGACGDGLERARRRVSPPKVVSAPAGDRVVGPQPAITGRGTEVAHRRAGPAPLSPAGLDAAPGALAAETLRAYRRACAAVAARVDGAALDDASMSAVLADMAAEGLSRSTLAQTVAAVRFAARMAGSPDPVGPSCEVVLRAHRRTSPPARQVAAVGWSAADAAAAVAAASGADDIAGLRDAAVVLVMSDAMLRVSELAALDVADIAAADDGSGTVTVRRSKTDQDAAGAVLYLGASTMRRVRAWLDAAQIADGPLIRPVNKSGATAETRISARSVRRIVGRCGADIGIDGASGHSLRVGAAQSLVRAGATLPEAQQAGRWQSPAMPARYARAKLAGRGAVARLRHGAQT